MFNKLKKFFIREKVIFEEKYIVLDDQKILELLKDIRLDLAYLFDRVTNEFDYPWGEKDSIEINGIEKASDYTDKLIKQICETIGHELIPDQCGNPDHDYCAFCRVIREDLTKN